jgi:hypothetical protein
VFWGYFPAYDWVAFVWLFGGLEELPFHFPSRRGSARHFLCTEDKPAVTAAAASALTRGRR